MPNSRLSGDAIRRLSNPALASAKGGLLGEWRAPNTALVASYWKNAAEPQTSSGVKSAV